jgi:hypothetical protein
VVDELITWLGYDVGHAKAAEFLGLIHDATDNGALAIHRIDEHLWVQAEAIFLRYADARLCDPPGSGLASVPGTTRVRYDDGRAARAAEARHWWALIRAGRQDAFSE